MPIRKENLARYPKNWKTEVVPRIRARSGNRCECTGQCGVQHTWSDRGRCGCLNGDIGWRDADGEWHIAPPHELGQPFGDAGERVIKIVLTVMHLNHTPEDCSDENLLHACQGCHNRYDAPMRRAGIKARARDHRAAGDLFTCKETA